jgi:uncharacterized membrane protein YqjE
MDEPAETSGGILSSLGRLLRAAVALAHNRLELMLVELQEERWRFFEVVALAAVVSILAAMTLLVATITIVAVCIRADRLDLIIWLLLFYLVATVVGFWRLRARLKQWAPFSATLAELKKDKACLEDKS